MRPEEAFAALPPYLGSKRKLAPLLFAELTRHLPVARWRGARLLDPMSGGGAVALFAKALGFHVTASDLAERGALVARALVANSDVRLQPADIVPFFTGVAPAHDREMPGLTGEQARWFAHAMTAADQRTEPVRSLLRLLCVTQYLRAFPLSLPAATDARLAAEDDFDRISPRRLGHYLSARHSLNPQAIWRLATRINRGVFAGHGRALQGDAREVIADEAADIVVLDPPYPGTTRYELAYARLDALLGDVPPATVSAPTLDELLDAAHDAAYVLVTFGGPKVSLNWLVESVSRHRAVLSAVSVHYPHLYAVASGRKRATNHEQIIIAGRR